MFAIETKIVFSLYGLIAAYHRVALVMFMYVPHFSGQAACIPVSPGFTSRRALLQKPVQKGRCERRAMSTFWPTQPDLSPLEHLLKLIDLLPCICQTVTQARGDLDEDKGSIVKMSLCFCLLNKL